MSFPYRRSSTGFRSMSPHTLQPLYSILVSFFTDSATFRSLDIFSFLEWRYVNHHRCVHVGESSRKTGREIRGILITPPLCKSVCLCVCVRACTCKLLLLAVTSTHGWVSGVEQGRPAVCSGTQQLARACQASHSFSTVLNRLLAS